MNEHELELRLRAAAGTLDERAPSFDLSRLPTRRARRIPRGIVIACIALAAVAAAPIAVPAIRGLFEVDAVPTLGPLEYGVAPPLAGRSVPISTAQASTPWRIHMLPSLGEPNEARVRDDITGGMVTLVYRSIVLTQWRVSDVSARIALVPTAGKAEEVDAGDLKALWVEGTARGTFTLIGADGTVHRESFDVGPGILLWRNEGMTFLLQGSESQSDAIRLAATVD